MAPSERGGTHLIYSLLAYYSSYRPLKDERLSWPSWLTCRGRRNDISRHPSATGRTWNEKVRRSKTNVLTTVPRNQPTNQHHSAVQTRRSAEVEQPQSTSTMEPVNRSITCRHRGPATLNSSTDSQSMPPTRGTRSASAAGETGRLRRQSVEFTVERRLRLAASAAWSTCVKNVSPRSIATLAQSLQGRLTP